MHYLWEKNKRGKYFLKYYFLNDLTTFERKIFRRICGSKRIIRDLHAELKTNREIEELYRETNVVRVLQNNRLSWVGQV